ncbi:MAG: NAD(P)/FAD-dependent oxidoreductase [Eubacteriales bacterium]|nr:NAD(P)/FAD-dependent oxidoreductase [Eubacteriales bacterium]
MQHFDVAVLGAGSGLIISEAALEKGLSCAVVEKGAWGGTCLNRGCIPSKMLVYPADLIREARRGGVGGVTYPEPQIDWAKITRNMQDQIDANIALEKEMDARKGLTTFKGTASFVDGNTLKIQLNSGGSALITADTIIIATGARTRIPEIRGLHETGFKTSESIFGGQFPKAPYESLLIIGGGATGCEFAHIFSAFGSQVTLTALRARLLRRWEPEISQALREGMEALGVTVQTNFNAVSMVREKGLKHVTFQDMSQGGQMTLSAQEVFLAPGIVPNTDMLNLPAAGILTDHRGFVLTNNRLNTNLPHVYAIGDVNGVEALRHKANYEAEVLVDILFGTGKRVANYSATPKAVYTSPQCASVGMTEEEARACGVRPRVAYNRYSDIVAGMAMGYLPGVDDGGFAKIITDESGRLMGAHVIGHQAAALAQPFTWLMNAGGPRQLNDPGSLSPILRSMVIHPSLNELTAWALNNFKDPPPSQPLQ